MAKRANDIGERPWLWVISGPNGSGKTTFAKRFLTGIVGGLDFVNVDNLALCIDRSSAGEAAIQAARAAIKDVRERLKSGSSFAIETTLAGRYHRRLFDEAKKQDWRIGLIFLWVGTPELAIQRVQVRVRSGGHDIPEPTIRRRFRRGLKNLAWFVERSDRVSIYDNIGTSPLLVVAYESGERKIAIPETFEQIRLLGSDL